MTSTLLIIGFTLLMLPSLVFIPMMMPGVPYLFVVAVLFGIVDHFTQLSFAEMGILAGIAVLSVIVDQLAGFIGARKGGAKGKSFIYGIIGLVVGNIIMPIIGGFIGLFIGIFVGEMRRRRALDAELPEDRLSADHVHSSLKAAGGAVLGSISGIVINMCLAVVFIGLFLTFTL
jgi:uncharacterized protein